MTTDIITLAISKVEMDECISKNVQKEKIEQLRNLQTYLQALRNEYWDEVLLEQICKKKTVYLEAAKTIGELREIMEPAKPHYNGSKFQDGKYQMDAEELIGWSRMSLHHVPNSAAIERMKELFTRIYGQPPDAFKR